MKWANYLKENFTKYFGLSSVCPDDLHDLYDCLLIIAGERPRWCPIKQSFLTDIPSHEFRDEMIEEFTNFTVSEFEALLKVPKVPLKGLSNTTPVLGYVYWITLTPKDGGNESFLRDYINYLKSYNPLIIGAFERGSNGLFHAHLIIQQNESIDTSKTPYKKYLSLGIIKNNTNLFRLKNLEVVLLKIRYMLKESKENYGYFGDYNYWNDLVKSNLDQVIIKPERYEIIKEKFNCV